MRRVLVLIAAVYVAAFAWMAVYRGLTRDVADQGLVFHDAVIERTAAAPYRYRVLMYTLTDPAIELLHEQTGLKRRTCWAIVTLAAQALLIALMAHALILLCLEWGEREAAFLALLLYAIAYPFVFGVYYPQLYINAEVVLVAYGIVAARRGNLPAVCALTWLAAFNRETGLLLPLAVAAVWSVRAAAPALAIWAAVFVGLRLALGEAAPTNTLGYRMAINTQPLQMASAAGHWAMFAGPMAAIVALGAAARGLSRSSVRLLAVAGVYAGLLAVYTIWRELRHMMLVLMLPAAVEALGTLEAGAWPRGTQGGEAHAKAQRREEIQAEA